MLLNEMLGFFNFREGGSVYLDISRNMLHSTESSTYIHELHHSHLMNNSPLGIVLNMLEAERIASNQEDYNYSSRISKVEAAISKHIMQVQEIYANNMELLWIENLQGAKEMCKNYEQKPREYQYYYDCLRDINSDNTLTYKQKVSYIHNICVYSLACPISSDAFFSACASFSEMDKYLSGDNNPFKRLMFALESYKNNQRIPSIDYNEVVLFFQRIPTENCKFLYMGDKLNEYVELFSLSVPELMKRIAPELPPDSTLDDLLNHYNAQYNEHIQETVKVFDFSSFKVIRGIPFPWSCEYGFLIIKHASPIANMDNFYIITYINREDELIFIGEESSFDTIKESLRFKTYFAIMYQEYEMEKNRPIFIQSGDKIAFVFIEKFQDCLDAIEHIIKSEDEIYIGDLFESEVNNFFTIMFFRARTTPKTIFIFPTIKNLSQRVLKKFALESNVLSSDKEEFFKIFSAFSDEAEMLKSLRWIVSFITRDSQDSREKSPAFLMSVGFTRSLLDSSLKFKIKDYFPLLAAQPTGKTKGAPFYTIMLFRENKNTGIMYAHKVDDVECPIFFISKEGAEAWKEMQHKSGNNDDWRALGVDVTYWQALKNVMKNWPVSQQRIVVCDDSQLQYAIVTDYKAIDRYIEENNPKHYNSD